MQPTNETTARSHRTCIVVPCYNEERRLDVRAFEDYLAATHDVCLLLVNDGSKDGTLKVLHGLAAKFPERVSVLDVQPNGGKAEAVRRGMQQAMQDGRFSYAGYWDADLATPLDAIAVFWNVLDRLPNVEIVFGTRVGLLGRQIERKPIRHYLGRVFATAASIVLSLPIYDTQCGAKLFRINDRARALFEAPFGSRWIFDVELVARYLHELARAETGGQPAPTGKVGIYELPLDRWEDVGDSKVRGVDFVRAIGEMAAIYRAYRFQSDKRALVRLVTAPFVRYAAAGAIGTMIHFGVLTTAVEIARASPRVGTIVGATFGALINYVLNYHLTFASKLSHASTLPRFLAVAALGVALNAGVMNIAATQLGVHYFTAQVLGTLVVLCVGYMLNKTWTFRVRESVR